MPLKLHPSRRINSITKDGTNPEVYILQTKVKAELSMQELCYRINQSCSLTEADVLACISQLNHQVWDALQQGYKVNLGDLGSFKMAVQSASKPQPSDLKKSDIQKLKINYQPSKRLKKQLRGGMEMKIVYKK
ncbi:HU family DNA-binding protein [Psychroflexus montanilacus]|uniref:HU family DNA-binding protein n=1 Tax=Psychroflexus montanilacus TaxID=2873598 RepID=UPI001CCF456F|nr:DNA-binding domain-containing protein [Psychroflexus montanilacus]MBZ9651007.1 HU family DNA-binding protein [Psychroflexus montanilacus]